MPQMNVGFEIEIILDDLGRPEFSLDEIGEPMDIASEEYCQAVADILSEATGHVWGAIAEQRWGEEQQRDPSGFYVIPEFDLDPLFFEEGQIAGVEIITPPLPLEEAEGLRDQIREALAPYAEELGWDHMINQNCGWHINVDFNGKMPDPVRWLVMVDEYAMIAGNGRECNRESGSAVRSVLLSAIDAGLAGGRLEITKEYLSDVMRQRAEHGKRFAANFARGNYVELRHFGVVDFMSDTGLAEYLSPLLEVELSSDEDLKRACRDVQVRADVLAEHARQNVGRILISQDCHMKNLSRTAQDIYLDEIPTAITRREIKSLGVFGDPTTVEYGEGNILIVSSEDNLEGFIVPEWEGGTPEARLFMLAYEGFVLQQYAGMSAQIAKSESFNQLGLEIADAMRKSGASMVPRVTLDPEISNLEF